jgi:hypothetical protein
MYPGPSFEGKGWFLRPEEIQDFDFVMVAQMMFCTSHNGVRIEHPSSHHDFPPNANSIIVKKPFKHVVITSSLLVYTQSPITGLTITVLWRGRTCFSVESFSNP